jgi:hypothetical protein
VNLTVVHRGSASASLAILGLLALLAVPVQASPDWRYRTEIVGGWRHVQEREDGTTLVRESGLSAGIRSSLERPVGVWMVRMGGELSAAALDYDGSTQAGAPLHTDTDWSSERIAATVGRRFKWAAGVELNGRLEYQHRVRDISSKPGAAGLTENYRTLWLGLGTAIAPIALLSLELNFACAIHSKVDVEFDSALDDASISVDRHCRAGFAAPFEIARIGKSTVYLRPHVDWERYPRSADAQLTSGGAPVGRVHLPKTTFVALGVSIGFGRGFE